MSRITGRTALVTGAGNGLGRAIARSLAAAGADLVLVGRDTTRLEETRHLATEHAVRARVESCDVSDPRKVAELGRRLADAPVSILVNNAGVAGPVRALVDIDPAEWDAVFASNVRSAFLMSRAFLPGMMRARRGDIVNIASVTGKRPLARRTPYAASKLALIGLTRTLAFEVAQHGVTVNCLSPGPVAGARMARNFEEESRRSGSTPAEAKRAFTARAAQERMLTEQEVGDAVVATLSMTGLCGADIDLSAGMIAPA